MNLATVSLKTPAICFTVFGKAVPSGVRPVPLHGPHGGSRIAEGNDRDHEKRIKSWKQEIAWAARQQYDGPLFDGPIAMEVVFYRTRPKSHYGTGKNADRLKPSAPRYPVTTPDTDKLSRLVRDALKAVLYTDDSRIVEERMLKLYGEPARCEVTVWVLEAAQQDTEVPERIVDVVAEAA